MLALQPLSVLALQPLAFLKQLPDSFLVPGQTSSDQINEKEWDAVRDLIDEVEKDQKREQLATSLIEWRLAVKQFRKVEMNRIVLGTPGDIDFSCHSICIHSLLAMGEALELWSREFETDHLALLNIAHCDIKACVEDLRQSYREWHHGFTDAEVRKTRGLIFGAEA